MLALALVILSKLEDRSSRGGFVKVNIIRAQQHKLNLSSREKETLLLNKQHDQESLLHAIFPRKVAERLIAKSRGRMVPEEKTLCAASLQVSLHTSLHQSIHNLTRLGEIDDTVAENHSGVTILFTDIVGFTGMSQTCKPLHVMRFLDELFRSFDHLADQDDCLWKVETIGDAYMIASGLNIANENNKSSSISNASPISEEEEEVSPMSPDGSAAQFAAAEAAIHFGIKAIMQASSITMPNGKFCDIRAGAHTGDVVSGVVGHRMPRYTLFGDTVNTASRMESTSEACRLQISQDTHSILLMKKKGDGASSSIRSDCSSQTSSGWEWQRRGQVKVKGKGEMTTYFLSSEEFEVERSSRFRK
jgi:class 3 adenylate cyclase